MFAGLGSLVQLNLEVNLIGTIGRGAFVDMTALEVLDLSLNMLTGMRLCGGTLPSA